MTALPSGGRKPPAVAVVLVNYNGILTTRDCVVSLLACGYEDPRIFVVDNGSTDTPTPADLGLDEGKGELLLSSENRGFAAACNIGIRRGIAEGCPFLLLLNNDTVVSPGFIEPLVAALEADDRVGAATGLVLYPDGRIWYAGGRLYDYLGGCAHHGEGRNAEHAVVGDPRHVTFASCCLLMIRASVVREIGWMDEEYFLYFEDTDYCHRLRDAGYTIWFAPDSVVMHRVGATTGRIDGLREYYWHRNRPLYVRKNIVALAPRVTFWCWFLATRVVRACRSPRAVPPMVRGLRDYFRGKTGQGGS